MRKSFIIQVMIKKTRISIETVAQGRLDKVLSQSLLQRQVGVNPVDQAGEAPAEGLSRARLQQLIKAGHVLREGHAITDPNFSAHVGEVYDLEIPPPTPAMPQAEDIALDVCYEDADLLVINKPVGLVVHPAAGNWDHTLVNALLGHCGSSLSGIGGVARPGIVHRLDKDTSGLMVVAKNDKAHQALSAQFVDRSLSRVYQALVWGVPSPIAGQIEGAIGRHPCSRQKMAVVEHGGKDALTFFETLEVFGTLAALVQCKLATGRTHQIRVHMAHSGHSVVGDPLYGTRRRIAGQEKGAVALLQNFPRQALHAGEIKFIHPRTRKALKFKAPLPSDMMALIRDLRKKTVA